ncbi:hypothetical protein ACSSS7_006357 [Eimeria intestinalis]
MGPPACSSMRSLLHAAAMLRSLCFVNEIRSTISIAGCSLYLWGVAARTSPSVLRADAAQNPNLVWQVRQGAPSTHGGQGVPLRSSKTSSTSSTSSRSMRVPHLLSSCLLLSTVSFIRLSQATRGSSGSAVSFLLPLNSASTQSLGGPLPAAQEALGTPLQSPTFSYSCRSCRSQHGGGCVWGGPPLRALSKGAGPQAADAEEYLRLRNTVTNLSDFQGGQVLLQQQDELLLQQRQALKGQDAAEIYQRMRALREKGRRQPKKKELHITARSLLLRRIAEADLQQKARKARAFLESKHQAVLPPPGRKKSKCVNSGVAPAVAAAADLCLQVKVTLQLRGRERLSPENHLPLLVKLQQLLQDQQQLHRKYSVLSSIPTKWEAAHPSCCCRCAASGPAVAAAAGGGSN